MKLDAIKKLAAELALDRAIRYVAKDPGKNISTIMEFLEKAAIMPHHKKMIEVVKDKCKNDPGVMEQARRVASNPEMLYKLIDSWVIEGSFLGKQKRNQLAEEMGVNVPSAVLIDPTSACNLRCKGCWAGEYNQTDQLEPELVNRIITEARELGIHWVVLSGGEPFVYPHLLDVIAKHPKSFFMTYTNGTLINEEVADRLAELGNLSPSFSLEGWQEQTDDRRGAGVFKKVTDAMDRLRERGVFFGASITAMRNNIDALFSDDFFDFLIEKGVLYVWAFHYVPVGRDPNTDLMLTPRQRLWLVDRVKTIRQKKPIFIADFWNDGYYTDGCIAGGRQYFHINAAGDVEPCAFVHFSVDNIRGKSVRDVLQNPFFLEYQKRIPFNKNHLAPCPIIDAPHALQEMVHEVKACPTHKGAEQVLEGEVARHLENLSERWRKEVSEHEKAIVAT